MTKVIWNGPDGFANREVGAATGEGDLLECGAVYDVPPELAERLIRSNEQWSTVSDYDRLTVPQLKDVAKEQGRESYSSLTKNELVELVRSPLSSSSGGAGAGAGKGPGGVQGSPESDGGHDSSDGGKP